MLHIGIDPGPARSAFAIWDGSVFVAHRIADNVDFCARLFQAIPDQAAKIVIEKMCCYGRPVGSEVFATVWWSGIFQVRVGSAYPVVYASKPTLCRWWLGRPAGTDAAVRAALVERFGQPGRSRKTPEGVLWGIKADEWLAAAYAVAFAEGMDTHPSY